MAGLLLLTSSVLWLTSPSSGHAALITEQLTLKSATQNNYCLGLPSMSGLKKCWNDCPRRRPKPDKRFVRSGGILIKNDCKQEALNQSIADVQCDTGQKKKCFEEFYYGFAGLNHTLSLCYDSKEVHAKRVRLLEWDAMSLDVFSHDNGTLTLFLKSPDVERIFMAKQTDSHVHLLIMVNSSVGIHVDGTEANLVQMIVNESIQTTPSYQKNILRIGTLGSVSAFGGQLYMLDVFMRIINKKDTEGEVQYVMLKKMFPQTHSRLYDNYFTECICPYGSSFTDDRGCSDGSNRFGFTVFKRGYYFLPPDAVINDGNSVIQVNMPIVTVLHVIAPLHITVDKPAVLTSLSITTVRHSMSVFLVDRAGTKFKLTCIRSNGGNCGADNKINGSAEWIDTRVPVPEIIDTVTGKELTFHKLSWRHLEGGIVAQKLLIQANQLTPVLSVVLNGRYLDTDSRPGECFCFPGNGGSDKNISFCDECGKCQCKDGMKAPQENKDCQPFLTEIEPAYGPESGGTTITLRGGGLQPDTGFTSHKVIVKIGENQRCTVQKRYTNDSSIVCITQAMKKTTNANFEQVILVSLQVGTTFHDVQPSLKFTYCPDPAIENIHPYKTIVSGGLPITFTGMHMDSLDIQKQFSLNLTLVNSLQGQWTGNCSVHNSTILVCIVPQINLPSSHSTERQFLEADVGILLNGVGNYRNLTAALPNLGHLKIYKDPKFGAPQPFRLYLGDELLEIEGEGLSDGCQKKDYSIWLNPKEGHCKQECPVVELYDNRITCRAPQTLACNKTEASVLVEVGYNYKVELDSPVRYEFSILDNSKFVSGVIGGVSSLFAIAIISVLSWFYWKRRRRQKLAEFAELQQRCMDYEALIQRESDDPEDFLRLLSIDMREKLKGNLINESELNILDEIGHGNFGKVYKGSLCKGEKEKVVAVKTLKQEAVNNRELEEFLEEATIMLDFHHPNVLSFLGVVFKKGRIYVLLPFMSNGDLKNYIAKKTYNFITFTTYASDVAKGMAYLAEQKFIHRDLAARNCMVDGTERVVVADFGLARDIYEKDYYRLKDQQRPLPWKWMALECLLGHKFTMKSDVWSFGVLMWEIFTKGRKPYNEVRNEFLRDHLKHGHRLQKPKNCPVILWEVMWQCWLLNVDARPSFANIVDDLEKVIERYSGKTKGIDVDCRDTMGSEPQEDEHHPNKPILRQHNQNVEQNKRDQGQAQVDRYTLTPTNTILPQRHDINNFEELDAGYFDPIDPRFKENPTKETSRISVTNDDGDQGYLMPSNPHGSQTKYSDRLEKGGDMSLGVEIEPQYINQDGIMIQSEYLTPEKIESVM